MSGVLLRQAWADNASPMTLDGTRTYVVGSSRPVVIDPGPEDERHLRAVEGLLNGAAPVAILLTHAHADHAGNAAALSSRTGAPIWMGRRPRHLPFPGERVDRWLSTGDEVESDAGPLRVCETPGHAPEHLAFLWEGGAAAGTLFAGDLFLGIGDTTIVSSPEGNVRDYLRSLDVVSELGPGVIYPAHGPPLFPTQAVVSRYRSHRIGRIEQVRVARERQPTASAEELVDTVYGGALDPRLRPAAVGSVRAILEYLSAEIDRDVNPVPGAEE